MVMIMLKKLILFIKKKQNSIQFKLLNITILLILIPAVVISILSYTQYAKNLEQISADGTYQTIEQLSYSLNSYLSGLFQFSSTIYYNNDLMNALENSKKGSKYNNLEKEWTIEEQLDETLIKTRSDILSAYIISGGVIYRNGLYNESIDGNADYASYGWYRKALKSEEPFYVPTHLEQLIANLRNKVFSIVRRINSIKKTGRLLGVLKIDAKYSSIASICDKIQMGRNSGLLIMDQNKSVIYSSTDKKDYKELYMLTEHNTDRYFKTTVGGNEYIISSIKVPSADWTIISLKSVSELNKSTDLTRNFTILITFLCSAAAISILLLFTRGFLRPLLNIVRLMKEVRNGNLEVYFPEKRKDEIGYLGLSFNLMVHRISGMIDENTKLVRQVYETKLLQNEAQINALYSQIKPHFLFNTLNMISLLIRCNKTDSALENLDRLSDLLRCMTRFNREIPVREEIGLLNSYLSIQKTRYRDRLEYNIDIDERLYSFVIPALSFQPIVENTIVHGCEKRKEKTVIKIYSKIYDNRIEFCFEDNADGMDAEALKALRRRVYSADYSYAPESDGQSNLPKAGSGIGLINVNKRLKIKFGNKYGLKIDSSENVGTRISIILPRHEDSEESKDV